MIKFLLFLTSMVPSLFSNALASDAGLFCQNIHDQSSEFELSKDQKTAVLTIPASSQKTFQMECMPLESESFSVGCQDSGMPSIYQVIVFKNQERAFLYEYGRESAVLMSDLQCQIRSR